ncbi:prolyl oligopeptidase family serine peptidase [Hyphomonas sp.]|uniref:alpha/beta hydrolase family protein n=1 Tax=Hyphomonas sp. TaxID=87 RepID=UPI0030F5CD6D
MARRYLPGVRAIVSAGLIIALAGCVSGAAEPRHFGLGDLMQIEGYGSAVADPSGRWLVYEQVRPYGTYDDYSFRTYAYEKSGHQLWRYDPASGAAPELLPGLDPAPHSYQQGFSPSGRFLLVMQYRFGDLSIGAYDMVTDTYRRFGPVPAFSRGGEHNPVWISDEAFVYAALADGEQPAGTSVRAHTGQVLAQAWDDSWRGAGVTANEVRTTIADVSDQQAPGRLIRANARTGETTQLADGLFADLRVAPGGRYLAGLSVSLPRPSRAGSLVEQDLRRYRLMLFDLVSHQSRPLAPGLEFFPYTLAWSDDGERLAAFGWRPDEDARNGRFYAADIRTGKVMSYAHDGLDLVSERERGWRQRPERAAFLGPDLAVFARPLPPGEDQAARFRFKDIRGGGAMRADWYALSAKGGATNLTTGLADLSPQLLRATAGQLTVLAADGIYTVDTDGGRKRLTPDLPGRFRFRTPGTFATRSSVIRPDFPGQALVEVTGDGPARIVMVDLAGSKPPLIVDSPAGGAEPLAGSHASGSVLFRTETGPVSHLQVASVGAKGTLREISRINTHLDGIDFGRWQVVSYQVSDPEGLLPGRTVRSCVLLPPGYNSEAPPPLIVEIYPDVGPNCLSGGPSMAYPDPDSAYLWAGQGFAYARLTTPRDLIRTREGPIAGMAAVVDAGVTALIDQDLADQGRMTLYGFSQGGVSALFVAAKSPRFRAVIAKNSFADLFSHYFSGSGVYAYLYESFGAFLSYDSVAGSDFGIGRTPFEDPDAYIRNSPVFLAPAIDMPVLLIHSDMDGFGLSQFDEMYGALQRAGKEARYVRYWGEGHGPSSPANIRDLWARQMAFLRDAGAAP